jgi:hypothetical protein
MGKENLDLMPAHSIRPRLSYVMIEPAFKPPFGSPYGWMVCCSSIDPSGEKNIFGSVGILPVWRVI